jgi:protein required for attachment to host cells
MKSWYLVVADRGRARFLSLEWPDDPDVDGGPKLNEVAELTNPEAQLKDTELFSGNTGRNNTTGGHWGSGYDDHRDRHREMNNERFAKQCVETIEGHVRERKPPRMILAAESQMLGLLRRALNPAKLRDLEVTELSEDLTRQTPAQIHKVLAQRQILPAPHPPREGFVSAPGAAPPRSVPRS